MKHNLTRKALALIVFALVAIVGRAQTNLNSYKYVLVPERFSFSKEDNQYSLSTSTKLLLEHKGFVAFIGNKGVPSEVVANKCAALVAELVQNNNMFVTKLTLLLKDCQGNIVFKSKEGKSREKEFAAAYNQALSDAFSSLNEVAYKYDSTIAGKQQVATVVTNPPAPSALDTVAEISGVLYAQSTPNGFQLVDTTPKKVLVLFKTSLQDYFIAEAGALHGIIFKKDGEWTFEYYKDDKLVSRKLTIRF